MKREAIYKIIKTIPFYTDQPLEDDIAGSTTDAILALQTPAERHADELVKAIEKTAADRAYKAGLGVGEWEAFLNDHERAALAKIREKP